MSYRYDEGTLPLAEVNPMAYAPIYPHDPIEEIGTDVFMARGSIKEPHRSDHPQHENNSGGRRRYVDQSDLA
ncbi:MAG: hypothetical protein VCB59_00400 [Gammaproteobacteria bacterium]